MSSPIVSRGPGVRRTFWATAVFYCLIAFEFLYMASPFAAYFYAAYRPGLNFFGGNPVLAWLGRTFLPHVVTSTTNPLIDLHNAVGAVVAGAGLLGFCIGAGHVYFHKLFRRGVAQGGIYRVVRHPQYACLALSGVGLLLLWPRYLVLLSFVAMLFAYHFLARFEERDCAARFGEPYRAYQRRTRMFLPVPPSIRIPVPRRVRAAGAKVRLPRRRLARAATVLGLYALAASLAMAAAAGVNRVALRSLYAKPSATTVYLSVSRMDAATLDELVRVAESDARVGGAVAAAAAGAAPNDRFIDYVLPADWYVSETLMRPRPGGGHHLTGGASRGSRYRVVFTRAHLRRPASGLAILASAAAREPVLEVVVDLGAGRVVEVLPPDHSGRYRDVPVPAY